MLSTPDTIRCSKLECKMSRKKQKLMKVGKATFLHFHSIQKGLVFHRFIASPCRAGTRRFKRRSAGSKPDATLPGIPTSQNRTATASATPASRRLRRSRSWTTRAGLTRRDLCISRWRCRWSSAAASLTQPTRPSWTCARAPNRWITPPVINLQLVISKFFWS